MKDLRVCAIQANLVWENPNANYQAIATLFPQRGEVDLVVLPEMFTTGFSMKPESVAEQHSLEMSTLVWMKSSAAELNAAITGSVSVEEDGHYYNRLYWVEPEGRVLWYDKQHLFTFANEDDHYTAGKNRMIVHWRGWNILPLICYDLRFPELARNGQTNSEIDYDLCIYVANWPAVRSHPWTSLLVARAIENQCYLIGCNRSGNDGNDIAYTGDSAILDPRGTTLTYAEPGVEEAISHTLSAEALVDFRRKFPVLFDRKKA